jgi:L-rhamnose mutarotase
MKRHCLALDLKNDPLLIEEYKQYHQKVWPEIIKSIKDAGIRDLEIYLTGNRLFMIIEADEVFSFVKKSQMDAENSKVQEWEALMWHYQQALPLAKENEKWRLMDLIFSLKG